VLPVVVVVVLVVTGGVVDVIDVEISPREVHEHVVDVEEESLTSQLTAQEVSDQT